MWSHLSGAGGAGYYPVPQPQPTQGVPQADQDYVNSMRMLDELRQEQYHNHNHELSPSSQTLSLCRSEQRILPNKFDGLLLKNLDLTGCSQLTRLPHSIGFLPKLKKLDLRGCTSLQALPDSLGQLSNLKVLDLAGCTSLQALPDGLGQLSKLEVLNLSGCTNLNRLPDSIGDLKNLRILEMICPDNQAELTCLPDSIGNLRALQTLIVTGCRNLSQVPETLKNLAFLNFLDLSDCALTVVPEKLGKLPKLHTIYLDRNQFTTFPDCLFSLGTKLHENAKVYFRGNNLPNSAYYEVSHYLEHLRQYGQKVPNIYFFNE